MIKCAEEWIYVTMKKDTKIYAIMFDEHLHRDSIHTSPNHVQSNQKMHDLYATMHIFQMTLPDAFWAVWSQIFS